MIFSVKLAGNPELTSSYLSYHQLQQLHDSISSTDRAEGVEERIKLDQSE